MKQIEKGTRSSTVAKFYLIFGLPIKFTAKKSVGPYSKTCPILRYSGFFKKKKNERVQNVGSFHPVTVTLLKLDYMSSSFGIELVMIIASFSENYSPK